MIVSSHRTSSSRHVTATDAGREHNLCEITAADHALFAIYQPSNGSAYDIANPFGRTSLAALAIRPMIDKCEDYMALVERLYRRGLMDRDSYIERTNETAWNLLLHRTALSRLGEIGRY